MPPVVELEEEKPQQAEEEPEDDYDEAARKALDFCSRVWGLGFGV